MTTIAVDTKGDIAADGQATTDIVVNRSTTKVVKIEDDYLCISGKIWKAHRFLDWYKGEKETLPDMEDLTIMKVSSRGEIYLYSGDKVCYPYPVEIEAPYAIGSGSKLAIGAMLHGASSEEAVKVAAKVDPYTNDNIKTYSIKDS